MSALLLEVTGAPTPEELAAVVAVLTAASSSAPAAEEPVPSRWNDRAALLRRPLPTGPDAWRAVWR